MDGVTNTLASNPGSLTGSIGQQVNKDQFLTLLVTQLKNQDPLEPVKNEQFLAQLATFTQLEEQQVMNDTLQQILSVQTAGLTLAGLAEGAALVGREVSYITEGGEQAVGVVETITFGPTGITALIDGQEIPAGNIIQLRGLAGIEDPIPTPGTGSNGSPPVGNPTPPSTVPSPANDVAP